MATLNQLKSYREMIKTFNPDKKVTIQTGFDGPQIFGDDEIYILFEEQFHLFKSCLYGFKKFFQEVNTTSWYVDLGESTHFFNSTTSYVDSSGDIHTYRDSETYSLGRTYYRTIYRRSLLTEYGEAQNIATYIYKLAGHVSYHISQIGKNGGFVSFDERKDDRRMNTIFAKMYRTHRVRKVLKYAREVFKYRDKYGFYIAPYSSNSLWRCPGEIENDCIDYDMRIQYIIDRAIKKEIKRIRADYYWK